MAIIYTPGSDADQRMCDIRRGQFEATHFNPGDRVRLAAFGGVFVTLEGVAGRWAIDNFEDARGDSVWLVPLEPRRERPAVRRPRGPCFTVVAVEWWAEAGEYALAEAETRLTDLLGADVRCTVPADAFQPGLAAADLHSPHLAPHMAWLAKWRPGLVPSDAPGVR